MWTFPERWTDRAVAKKDIPRIGVVHQDGGMSRDNKEGVINLDTQVECRTVTRLHSDGGNRHGAPSVINERVLPPKILCVYPSTPRPKRMSTRRYDLAPIRS